MKKLNFLNRIAMLITALIIVGGLTASTNFYAWDMSTARPGDATGIYCGPLSFTEKDFTIELWMNMPSANFTNGVTIASTRHDGAKGFSLDVTADGRLRGFFRNDDGDKLNGREDYVFPFFFNQADVADKWVHIAIVFSSTNNVARSYLNGEVYQDLVKSTDPYEPYEIGWIGNHASAMRLGYWYASSAHFYGKIADFRIWSVGRTDEEIKANYNRNLIGTYEDNPGLYINYRFYTYERGFVNDANPSDGTNKGWCNPEAGWNNYYARETLAAFPKNLVIDEGDLSWDDSDGEYEVSIYKVDGNGTAVFTDTIDTNFIKLDKIEGLQTSEDYYAKVRTFNNGFWSGQVESDQFSLTITSLELNRDVNTLTHYVKNGSLIINVETPQIVNIFSMNGQLVHSLNAVSGEYIVLNSASDYFKLISKALI